ncbi:MAG: hypothetical protein Q8O88_01175 [bacterium]|nr:hypothetical protein [bacterium]
MPNKNYRRGSTIERLIVNSFRKEGLTAYRSAGSHSPIDVTVHFPDRPVLAIQVKRVKKKGYNFSEEIESLRKVKTVATKELWIYRDYETRDKKWEKISIH